MQEDKVAISIIVPVYNVEKFLQMCIDSLLCQTMKNIEYIFINDASTDHSLGILERNAKTNKQIKVIDSKKNLCQGGARNLGIAAACGEYIGFVDSDDLVMPDMYAQLYKKAQETGADAVFIQYAAIGENSGLDAIGGGIPLIQWNKKLLALDGKILDDKGRMDLIAYPVGGICCGLWKKSMVEESGITFPEHLKYEDNYWSSLIKCFLKKVAFLPEIKYYYRQNSVSTVHKRNVSYHFDRVEIEKKLLADVKKLGFYNKYYQAWEYIYIFRYAFNTYWIYQEQFDQRPLLKMRQVIIDLRKEFPNWNKNEYYMEISNQKGKCFNYLVSKAPILMALCYPIIKKARHRRNK